MLAKVDRRLVLQFLVGVHKTSGCLVAVRSSSQTYKRLRRIALVRDDVALSLRGAHADASRRSTGCEASRLRKQNSMILFLVLNSNNGKSINSNSNNNE